MGIGAAIAGVGAIASIGGSLLSAGAAKDAASTQAGAADRASAAAQAQFQQMRADLAPYRDVGGTAVNRLASFTNGQDDPAAELRALEGTPGYQFALTQGLKSVQNSAAARGLGTSGAALKGAAGFATGLAQNTYQQNLLNPLQYLGTLGENAAAQTGSLGVQATQNANQAAIGGANALAAGTVGSANALSGGLSSAAGAPMNYLLYNKLLGGGSGASGGSSGFLSNYDPGAAGFTAGGAGTSTLQSLGFYNPLGG